ncbi:MAG: thioredoxin domain-containing protein [Bacteroidetes bacterium]|nr:thioredoxin domain-containing protein [Bacteroidota bacterium]MBS1930825.1 thioredoxin domain-containing protein [Bacteroidota bacterium]
MHTNKLISETSPYLLQHAHNPVEWFPWCDEAIQKAKNENKPILVSIGYSACHWCHVMERESFEDEITARIMNENFINIKIDREERPDLDHIYMDAVQAMTGSGGWPLNVFLTPDTKPFYGGTYFPPRRAYNRPSWQEVLQNVALAYKQKRNEIDAQAENLTTHLIQANSIGSNINTNIDILLKKENVVEIFENIIKSADKVWGGFGKAPKFPQPFIINYLLRFYHLFGNPDAKEQALLSIDKMIEGGIYDQIGGGFARYATDSEWLVPHFEKMLYDNALLVTVLSEAFQLTGKRRYKEVIEETIGFILRELFFSEGGFYSASDADSDGEEGKYYVWGFTEVQETLGTDADIFCEYYDISPHGIWERKNILRVKQPLEVFAFKKNLNEDSLSRLLKNCREKLLAERSKRAAPGKDDKINLGWNALMNMACSKAFAATGNELYRQLALKNMSFLLDRFSIRNTNGFYHTWKQGIGKYHAFLDDYAFLIRALIQLQTITANNDWLIHARELTEFVIENFSDEETGFFYYTEKNQLDVIIRKKEVYDNAVPSGNSMMMYNLYHLAIIFEKIDWRQRSINVITSLGKAIVKYPSSFGFWACLYQEVTTGTEEIVVIGEKALVQHTQLLKYYIPQSIIISSIFSDNNFPVLADKPVTQEDLIYLCRNFSCLPPVKSPKELISLINKLNGR